MSLRELTISEISQVSGAGCIDTSPEAYFQGVFTLLKVAQAYADHDPRYYGMTDTAVAATDPMLRKAMITMLDKAGAGGENTVNSWLNGNC